MTPGRWPPSRGAEARPGKGETARQGSLGDLRYRAAKRNLGAAKRAGYVTVDGEPGREFLGRRIFFSSIYCSSSSSPSNASLATH